MKKMMILSVALAATCMATTAVAQTVRAWRCAGNHYTNDAAEAKRLGGCTQLEDKLTILGGSGAPRPSTGTRPRGTSNTTNPPANNNMQISVGEQGRMDSDARTLIEAELSKKQSELSMLQGQYASGAPERLLSEANDDAAYKGRIERMSREIEKKVAEITAIQKELARMR